jgi:hypothetical protein
VKVVLALVAAFLGLLAASALSYAYPVLFDNFFTSAGMFDWVEFVPTQFVMLLLPRSAILFPFGFLLGFGITLSSLPRHPNERRSWWSLAAFLAAFLAVWGAEAEHLPRGVEATTRVLWFSAGPEDPDWRPQSEEWVNFVEWNTSPGLGYESFPLDFIGTFKSKDLDVSKERHVFLFIKTYTKNGETVATISYPLRGPQTSAQLKEALRTIAQSRTSAD